MKRQIITAVVLSMTAGAIGIGSVSADEIPSETFNRPAFSQDQNMGQMHKKGSKLDFAKIAEALSMSEEDLKAELLEAKEEGKHLFEYLQEKGLSEEEVKELLPKRPENGQGPRIDFSEIAEKLGMTEEELIEDFKESEMNPFEYLKNKGLTDDEIKELLPKPKNGNGHGPKIDFSQIAEKLGMSEEDLKAELMQAKEDGKRFIEYLQEKGLSEEEIKELLPKRPGNGQGPRINFSEIAEKLGMSEEDFKAELMQAKEDGKRFIEYLQEKGLSEEEIKELLPPPGQGNGHGPKIDFSEIAEKLGMSEEDFKAELIQAKEEGKHLFEYLQEKGFSEEEIKELLPKRNGNGQGQRIDFSEIAAKLGMTEEELIEDFKESEMNPFEYLKSKGLTEEEIKELLPKKGGKKGNGEGRGQGRGQGGMKNGQGFGANANEV